jgi:hypothetical protein
MWAEGLAQVVEHLPNKHETLSSNSNTVKKNYDSEGRNW